MKLQARRFLSIERYQLHLKSTISKAIDSKSFQESVDEAVDTHLKSLARQRAGKIAAEEPDRLEAATDEALKELASGRAVERHQENVEKGQSIAKYAQQELKVIKKLSFTSQGPATRAVLDGMLERQDLTPEMQTLITHSVPGVPADSLATRERLELLGIRPGPDRSPLMDPSSYIQCIHWETKQAGLATLLKHGNLSAIGKSICEAGLRIGKPEPESRDEAEEDLNKHLRDLIQLQR